MSIDYNPFSLKGKTILVTGASSGIGRSIAIECSKMGATVIISARDKVRLQETYDALINRKREHKQIIANLIKSDDINTLVSTLPDINGVVLCAGKSIVTPLQFSSKEKFEDIFSINFFAPVELLRLLYKKKTLQKDASVVLIASIGGITSFASGCSIYGASKAALDSVMKYACKEFSQRRVRVNCICPGMVETPLIHEGTISAEQLNEDKNKYPLQRYGQPEDIAYSAVYLLSNASSWITGTDLIIDGGISVF